MKFSEIEKKNLKCALFSVINSGLQQIVIRLTFTEVVLQLMAKVNLILRLLNYSTFRSETIFLQLLAIRDEIFSTKVNKLVPNSPRNQVPNIRRIPLHPTN